MAERAVHRFERILGAGNVVLERRRPPGELSARKAPLSFCARMSSICASHQIGEAAPPLHRLEDTAEARVPRRPGPRPVRPSDPRHQHPRPPRRHRARTRSSPPTLPAERLHQGFQPGGTASPFCRVRSARRTARRCADRGCERVAGRPPERAIGRPFRRHLHLAASPPHGLVGGDMGGNSAQGDDGAFELRHRGRVFLRDDQVDLWASLSTASVKPIRFSAGSARATRRALRRPASMPPTGGVAAGLRPSTMVGRDFGSPFYGVDGLARHGVAERARDFASSSRTR